MYLFNKASLKIAELQDSESFWIGELVGMWGEGHDIPGEDRRESSMSLPTNLAYGCLPGD